MRVPTKNASRTRTRAARPSVYRFRPLSGAREGDLNLLLSAPFSIHDNRGGRHEGGHCTRVCGYWLKRKMTSD